MALRTARIFMCDFETTVYKGQVNTEVWASASVELFTEDVNIFHSIGEQFEYFIGLKSNVIAYYHNLKFDGSFWLDYLLIQLGYKQATATCDLDNLKVSWLPTKDMPNKSFKYSISDKGQWYGVTIKVKGHVIELRDSLKLLPFSIRNIGKSFKTKHRKLDMEYEGFRYAGCPISEKEKEYISNDVLVAKEALEIMFSEGHKKLTIGSCCMSEYKTIIRKSTAYDYNELFPNVYDFRIKPEKHKYETAGEWIRRSYKGAWCYLVKGKENKVYHNGITADVNSLYPSMMHSESGNKYPVGKPIFWTGNFIPDEALGDNRYYFVRIKTRFYLKPGMLPFIQIKGNYLYKGTEALETSDVRDPRTGDYYTHYPGRGGKVCDTRVELTLTMTDYQLIKEHYELVDFEILDGCWFYAQTGIFDEYIDKYRKIKETATGARRTLAKLYLNNLYGKLATSTDSSFKFAYIKDGNIVGFVPISEHDKEPGYIPCGSAITSYARNFTIRAAQKNFHGADKPGFIYADTDSVHMDIHVDEIQGIPVHETAFCHWKLESCWDMAIFARQKTYIEHVTHENLSPIDKPYYNVKCAGMPDSCKEIFELSMSGEQKIEGHIDKYTEAFKEWSEDEKVFLFDADGEPIVRTIADFKRGIKVPGKLLPKRIPGGILLKNTTYEMR